jgi:hypothetical protein
MLETAVSKFVRTVPILVLAVTKSWNVSVFCKAVEPAPPMLTSVGYLAALLYVGAVPLATSNSVVK